MHVHGLCQLSSLFTRRIPCQPATMEWNVET